MIPRFEPGLPRKKLIELFNFAWVLQSTYLLELQSDVRNILMTTLTDWWTLHCDRLFMIKITAGILLH